MKKTTRLLTAFLVAFGLISCDSEKPEPEKDPAPKEAPEEEPEPAPEEQDPAPSPEEEEGDPAPSPEEESDPAPTPEEETTPGTIIEEGRAVTGAIIGGVLGEPKPVVGEPTAGTEAPAEEE